MQPWGCGPHDGMSAPSGRGDSLLSPWVHTRWQLPANQKRPQSETYHARTWILDFPAARTGRNTFLSKSPGLCRFLRQPELTSNTGAGWRTSGRMERRVLSDERDRSWRESGPPDYCWTWHKCSASSCSGRQALKAGLQLMPMIGMALG